MLYRAKVDTAKLCVGVPHVVSRGARRGNYLAVSIVGDITNRHASFAVVGYRGAFQSGMFSYNFNTLKRAVIKRLWRK